MNSVPDGDIMVRNEADGGAVRLWFGTGAAAGLYDHGADWKVDERMVLRFDYGVKSLGLK